MIYLVHFYKSLNGHGPLVLWWINQLCNFKSNNLLTNSVNIINNITDENVCSLSFFFLFWQQKQGKNMNHENNSSILDLLQLLNHIRDQLVFKWNKMHKWKWIFLSLC